jgi:hypothetical protein
MASLQSRLSDLITAIGADIKALQGSLSKDMIEDEQGWFLGKDGTGTVDSIGATVPTNTGTITGMVRAITNIYTRTRKVEFLVTVAATTAVAGWRIPAGHLLRGNAAGVGGFLSRQIWGPATGVSVATNRAFVGIAATTGAPTDVQPSTQISCIGMGWDSADVNIQIMHNDAAGTCTKVDLGASFPVPTADRTNMYEIEIWCAPNESKFNWRVTNLGTGAVASGDTGASTDIPANTAYLAERGWMSVGGTSSVIGIGMSGGYYETRKS